MRPVAWLAAVFVALALSAGCGGTLPQPLDAGAFDAGALDAGALDAGALDAGALDAGSSSPFAVGVVSFHPGPGAGFGQDRLPGVVEGPPVGGGDFAGGTDVLSLGAGGAIVLELGEAMVDGPGPDFTVFENAFRTGAGLYREPGAVAVSDDGVTFTEFPCDPDAGEVTTCAGMSPVLSSPSNGVSPLDPAVSGGDPFDLEAIGVARARYVRVRDLGLGGTASPTAGFDLDAIAVINAEP